MLKKIVITLVIIFCAVFGYFYSDINKTLNTATGFAAKNLCSGHYNSGYPLEQLMSEALIPVNPGFEYVSYIHDQEKRQINTSIFGMKQRTAQFRSGMGCTLLGVGQESLSGEISLPVHTEPNSTIAWPDGIAKPVEQDYIDYVTLNSAIDAAFAETEATGLRHTKAVVVIHKGQLVAERYAAPISRTTPSLSWSMAKSIINLLIGTLVHQGKIDIYEPAPISEWRNDNRSNITIDHLLRMSSGLEFNETYGINTDVTYMLSNAVSAADYASSFPLAHAVDSHWSYSSGTSNILAKIVFDTIGGDLQDKYDYAQQMLFEPLGIHSAIMETDGSNVFIGSSYFYATPLDYAKLGQVVLQDGVWNGQQLFPEGWIKYSAAPSATAPNREYGAHFWLNSEPVNDWWTPPWPDAPSDAFFMSGYQGQFVIIIPSQELVVVRLGYTYPGTNEGINDLLSGIMTALNK